jgi:hypothetical protein
MSALLLNEFRTRLPWPDQVGALRALRAASKGPAPDGDGWVRVARVEELLPSASIWHLAESGWAEQGVEERGKVRKCRLTARGAEMAAMLERLLQDGELSSELCGFVTAWTREGSAEIEVKKPTVHEGVLMLHLGRLSAGRYRSVESYRIASAVRRGPSWVGSHSKRLHALGWGNHSRNGYVQITDVGMKVWMGLEALVGAGALMDRLNSLQERPRKTTYAVSPWPEGIVRFLGAAVVDLPDLPVPDGSARQRQQTSPARTG